MEVTELELRDRLIRQLIEEAKVAVTMQGILREWSLCPGVAIATLNQHSPEDAANMASQIVELLQPLHWQILLNVAIGIAGPADLPIYENELRGVVDLEDSLTAQHMEQHGGLPGILAKVLQRIQEIQKR